MFRCNFVFYHKIENVDTVFFFKFSGMFLKIFIQCWNIFFFKGLSSFLAGFAAMLNNWFRVKVWSSYFKEGKLGSGVVVIVVGSLIDACFVSLSSFFPTVVSVIVVAVSVGSVIVVADSVVCVIVVADSVVSVTVVFASVGFGGFVDAVVIFCDVGGGAALIVVSDVIVSFDVKVALLIKLGEFSCKEFL